MEFETPRLTVRRIGPSDYDTMFEVYGDPRLMTYVGDGHPISPEDCARWIEVTQDNYQKRGYGLFTVESLAFSEHVGFVGVTHPGGQPLPEIKYVLRQKFWAQGLAQELVQATCAHATLTWNLDRIIATVHPDNTVSNKVLEKCGFQRIQDITDPDGSQTWVWEFRARLDDHS